MTKYMQFLIRIFRNSIGDEQEPSASFWCEGHKKEFYGTGLEFETHEATEKELEKLRCNYLVVGVIWLTFFLNVMVILIILLNFLIAIVSNSYEYVMSN